MGAAKTSPGTTEYHFKSTSQSERFERLHVDPDNVAFSTCQTIGGTVWPLRGPTAITLIYLIHSNLTCKDAFDSREWRFVSAFRPRGGTGQV